MDLLDKTWKKMSKTEKVDITINFYIFEIVYPANIYWSSRRLQDMSWRRLQHVSSVTIFHKTSWKRLEDFLEDEKLLRWRRLEGMSWRRLRDMSSRHLGDKENVYWEYLYLTNLNVYLMVMLETWERSVDKGKVFGALLTVLTKAFDCLDHELLTAKINAYGFSLPALTICLH